MKKLFLLLILLTLSGCAAHRMYEGEPRKSEDVVKISGMSGLNPINDYRGAMVCEVDGLKLDPCQTDVELLPGEHTLLLKATNLGMSAGEAKVTKSFNPGSKYVIALGFKNSVDTVPVLMKKK